jgi:RNA 2',3'-cyclic 3'-phosphodiesterase
MNKCKDRRKEETVLRRIFIGLTLDEKVRRCLSDLQDQVRPLVIKGRFTNPQLMHLTIQFLGTISDAQIMKLMASQENWVSGVKPFDLQLQQTGMFKKRNKAILWVGVKSNDQLLLLAEQIKETMAVFGFHEDRPFRPHITLAREAVFVDDQSIHCFRSIQTNIPPILVKQFELMESTQENGRLIYRSLSSTLL